VKETTAQDASGSTIAPSDDLRVDRFVNMDESTRFFDTSLPAKIDETLHPREMSVEGGEVSGR
jgi:hypothetical protein